MGSDDRWELDLDVDATREGAINQVDDPIEISAGGIVALNVDDDDGNGQADMNQVGYLDGERSLIPLELWMNAGITGGTMTLRVVQGADRIRIWSDPSKYGVPLELPVTWTIGEDDILPMLFIEGIAPSDAPRDIVLEVTVRNQRGNRFTDTIALTVLDVGLATDYNQDRRVDGTDLIPERRLRPFRFWINNDQDNGEESGIRHGDYPERRTAKGRNHSDQIVNGRCDMIDFFPIRIDVRLLSQLMAPGECRLILLNSDNALNAVWSNRSGIETEQWLMGPHGIGYGDNLTQLPHEAMVVPITANGTELPCALMDYLWNTPNEAVVWIEAKTVCRGPLTVQARDQNGNLLVQSSIQLSITDIREMQRFLNVRNVARDDGQILNRQTEPSRPGDPPNWPDTETNGRTMVALHGYNADEMDAIAFHSEMFKKLFWSGLRSRYIGVAWFGDESHLICKDFTPDYHENVINAFQTSQNLAEQLQAYGEINILLAHSLGNMVASSMIEDEHLNVQRYFALNSAVAMESYDQAAPSHSGANSITAKDAMRHDEWLQYDDRLCAWSWHLLFTNTTSGTQDNLHDERQHLTWINRFRNVPGVMFNYYSSGDEVLDNANGITPRVSDMMNNFNGTQPQNAFAWCGQEVWKGRTPVILGWDIHGGWGFSEDLSWAVRTNPTEIPAEFRTMYQSEIPESLATDEKLRVCPFFLEFEDSDQIKSYDGDDLFASLGNVRASDEASERNTRAKILAEAIPAQSFAVGRNLLPDVNSVDMNQRFIRVENEWPHRYNSGAPRWLHCDYIMLAYYFTAIFYDDVVRNGRL